MSHYKRRKPKSKVRCVLCTDNRAVLKTVRFSDVRRAPEGKAKGKRVR